MLTFCEKYLYDGLHFSEVKLFCQGEHGILKEELLSEKMERIGKTCHSANKSVKVYIKKTAG
jgi:hypothetical protein